MALELKKEEYIHWPSNFQGRKDQITREFIQAEAIVRKITTTFEQDRKHIDRLQIDDRKQIRDDADKAYQSLEAIVQMLLNIPDGDRRLSREDQSIMKKIQESIENFDKLSKTSYQNCTDLGRKAGDTMALGGSASILVKAMNERTDGLKVDVSAAWKSYTEQVKELSTLRAKAQEHRSRISEKQSSIDKAVNRILGFLNSKVISDLEYDRDRARDQLSENINKQDSTQSHLENYYQISILSRNALAGYNGLILQAKNISTAFYKRYAKVLEKQNGEVKLWEGLVDLRTHILSSDYISTRDRCLHKLLTLLVLDNEIFWGQDYYESTEKRIKEIISSKFGVKTLENLINGQFNLPLEDGEPGLNAL